MRTLFYSFLLFVCLSFQLKAQDYSLVFSAFGPNGSSWMGSYSEFGFENMNIFENRFTIIGLDGWSNIGCSAITAAMDASNAIEGHASLLDGKTLEITNNHPTSILEIYNFDCVDGEGMLVYTLNPDENITLLRTGNCIAELGSKDCGPDPIPTLSQWGLIIMLLSFITIGVVGIRRGKEMRFD